MLNTILEAIKSNEGHPLFVGGCVRDELIGIKPKDFDVEVFGIDADKLALVLSQFGKVHMVGASFGIIKLRTPEGIEFDFSLPRRENKEGRGHKGFIVKPDPTMTPAEAASRRDFTFNALARNPFNGVILDFFGGQADLESKVIRHTSAAFSEDPLRVLRAMQFAGRFDMTMASETVELSKGLVDEFETLSPERVWGEFWKWATKSIKPSCGLQVLKETGWIIKFPEISDLDGCPQDPEWHPEGDAFVHTMWVCDAATEIAIRENLSEEERGILVLSALGHDMGKPETTVFDGRWRSPAHDKVGEKIAINFLSSMKAPQHIINQVAEMTREHMVHVHNKTSERIVRRFLSRLNHCTVKQIMMIIEADHSGRPPLPKCLPEEAKKMAEMAADMGDKIEPILMGRHLLEMGFKPGVEMGQVLKRAFEAQLDGQFVDLEGAMKWIS